MAGAGDEGDVDGTSGALIRVCPRNNSIDLGLPASGQPSGPSPRVCIKLNYRDLLTSAEGEFACYLLDLIVTCTKLELLHPGGVEYQPLFVLIL
ncbi:MAG: hypothetical protein ACODAD_10880, partial [Planctomycetota bacterium]